MNDSMVKTFIAIYEEGSIGKASSIIGKTKPNIRKTLNNLESELNLSLFSRFNSGMEPTSEGNKFYETVKYLTYSIGELEKYYEKSKSGLELSLATNYMDYIMEYFSKTIKEKGIDNTKYRYVSTHSDEILRMLLEDRCGIGIFSFTSKNKGLVKRISEENNIKYKVLYTTTPCVYVRDNHPLKSLEVVNVSDLEKFNRIGLSDEENQMLSYKIDKKADITVDSIRNIISFIKDSDYYYIGIESPYGSCMDSLTSIPLDSYDEEIYVVLSYKQNYLNSGESKYFLELLRDFFKGGK